MKLLVRTDEHKNLSHVTLALVATARGWRARTLTVAIYERGNAEDRARAERKINGAIERRNWWCTEIGIGKESNHA